MMTPKSILNAYSLQANLDKPVYHTVSSFSHPHPHSQIAVRFQQEMKPQRIFRSVLDFNGHSYTTTSWYATRLDSPRHPHLLLLLRREKNKQLAEQGSAIVCLQSIGIDVTRAKYGVNHIRACLPTEN